MFQLIRLRVQGLLRRAIPGHLQDRHHPVQAVEAPQLAPRAIVQVLAITTIQEVMIPDQALAHLRLPAAILREVIRQADHPELVVALLPGVRHPEVGDAKR